MHSQRDPRKIFGKRPGSERNRAFVHGEIRWIVPTALHSTAYGLFGMTCGTPSSTVRPVSMALPDVQEAILSAATIPRRKVVLHIGRGIDRRGPGRV